jgi:hypothetical protein
MIGRIRRDEGITTTELIIAMAITAVLGVMTLTVILGLSRASDASTERSQSASVARTALESWDSLLAVRESPELDESAAPSIETITADSVVFFASIDNRALDDSEATDPTRIEIAASGTGIVERRFDPDRPEVMVAERHLVPNGSLAVRAYRADGRQIVVPASADSPLTDAQRAAIDRVALEITVRDERGRTYTYGGANDVPTTAE